MRARTLRALWLPAMLALGCSQPPSLSAEIDEYADAIADSYALTCDCYMDAGFPSRADCSDSLNFVGLDERQCMADALVGYESEGEQYLACVTSAYSEAVDCLTTNVAANCEEGGVVACVDIAITARESCTQLPSDVSATFLACSG